MGDAVVKLQFVMRRWAPGPARAIPLLDGRPESEANARNGAVRLPSRPHPGAGFGGWNGA